MSNGPVFGPVFLEALVNYEKRKVAHPARAFRLERMQALLALLGHPQAQLRTLHVAGTKGKGSVAHYLERILHCAGYRTGLFTSPHLVNVRERIRINGTCISKQNFTSCAREIRRALAQAVLDRKPLVPTYFEFLTACAFVFFQRSRVEFAVLETGLGGRLDATNVVRPLASILTSIDYDHCEILGHRLENIAREKAGIIKEGTPVVSDRQQPAAWRVIRRRAELLRAPLWRAQAARVLEARPDRLAFRLDGANGRANPYRLGTGHLVQARNAALVLRTVDCLKAYYSLEIKEDAIRKGLASPPPEGRFECLARTPPVVADGAHTPASVRCVAASLRRLFPRTRFRVLCAISRDKDAAGILRELARVSPQLWVTQVPGAKTLRARELARLARRLPCHVTREKDPVKAFRHLRRETERREGILVTGSFYLVGILKAAGVF